MQLAMLLKIRVSLEFKRQTNTMGASITIRISAIYTVRDAYGYSVWK